MKNRMNRISRMGLLLGITAITALCLASPAHAASRKPPQGGGSGGGLPYATASTLNQLIADINYANQAGGTITISLAPGTTFDLKSADNTTDGGNGLPVIGATKAVALTIIGNGATIRRIAVIDRYSNVKNPFRLFDVALGASLTLDHVTLQGGWSGGGGAIFNHGTLNLINGTTLSGNRADSGGGIYNTGIVTISNNSVLTGNSARGSGGGIYNAGGTVTINGTVSGNGALYYGGGIYNSSGTVTLSNGTLSGNNARFGGGLYNNGGTSTITDSTVNNNSANHYDYPWAGGYGGGIYNSAGTVVIAHSTLTGNTANPGIEDWFVVGGGIFNDVQGTVTVENDSHITGNSYDDVNNAGALYLDGTSTIGILNGTPTF